jgi:hypothetical protein
LISDEEAIAGQIQQTIEDYRRKIDQLKVQHEPVLFDQIIEYCRNRDDNNNNNNNIEKAIDSSTLKQCYTSLKDQVKVYEELNELRRQAFKELSEKKSQLAFILGEENAQAPKSKLNIFTNCEVFHGYLNLFFIFF